MEAQIKQAQAALELSESELARQENLMRSPGVTTQQELDRARSTRNQNRQLVVQLEADLETARLGSDITAFPTMLIDLSDRAKFKATGPDCKRFLNGQLTNDMLALQPGFRVVLNPGHPLVWATLPAPCRPLECRRGPRGGGDRSSGPDR